MRAAVAAFDRFWFATMPPERIATLRILVGGFALGYLLVRTAHLLSYAGFASAQFDPVGVATLLGGPVPPVAVRAATLSALPLGVAFVCGWRFRITGPLFAALLLWVLTYRNSWGMVFHTENLLVLHVLVLAVAPAADAWSLDARRGRFALPAPHPRYGWPVRLMTALVVVTYLLAGVAKVQLGGWGWSDGEVLRNYIATDTLRKLLLGSVYSPLAVPVMGEAWLFRVLGVLTLVVELGAPLALLGGRVALLWVVGAFGFHYGVLALMAIGFPYPMSGIAFACFFAAERLPRWLRARLGRAPAATRPG